MSADEQGSGQPEPLFCILAARKPLARFTALRAPLRLRRAQFEYINAKVIAAQAQQQPVISVDTKKKELIGNFKNGGTDYRPKGDPRRVNVHDLVDKKLAKVVPYGVYDMTANAGFVSVGITSDTAEFAVQSIRCWRDAWDGGNQTKMTRFGWRPRRSAEGSTQASGARRPAMAFRPGMTGAWGGCHARR
jgi:hypothetical protein